MAHTGAAGLNYGIDRCRMGPRVRISPSLKTKEGVLGPGPSQYRYHSDGDRDTIPTYHLTGKNCNAGIDSYVCNSACVCVIFVHVFVFPRKRVRLCNGCRNETHKYCVCVCMLAIDCNAVIRVFLAMTWRGLTMEHS